MFRALYAEVTTASIVFIATKSKLNFVNFLAFFVAKSIDVQNLFCYTLVCLICDDRPEFRDVPGVVSKIYCLNRILFSIKHSPTTIKENFLFMRAFGLLPKCFF